MGAGHFAVFGPWLAVSEAEPRQGTDPSYLVRHELRPSRERSGAGLQGGAGIATQCGIA
jgi:hypothetical protein